MKKHELKALCNALLGLAQREGILPTDVNELVDILQDLTSTETYITKEDLKFWLEWG